MPALLAARDYGVVNVRVRARYSAMLEQERWESLYGASDFPALINLLADTPYAPYLQIDRSLLTPRRAAFEIRKKLARTFGVVLETAPRSGQELITQLWRLFEIDNLKAILRGLEAGATWDRVRYILFPLGSRSVLPSEDMLNAGDTESAVMLLEGTPYYDPLVHALERYVAEQSLFPLEVALDLDHMRHLWDAIQELSGEDRKQVMRIVGTQIDVANLLWALRYRVYHNLSEEEIINYTLPFGYELHDDDIRAIASGEDMADVVGRIYPRLPEARSLLQDPREGLQVLEILLQRYIVQLCRKAFIGYPFHLGIPVAYLLLSEFEIQDLTAVIEAKAVHMPAERFKAHLVLGDNLV